MRAAQVDLTHGSFGLEKLRKLRSALKFLRFAEILLLHEHSFFDWIIWGEEATSGLSVACCKHTSSQARRFTSGETALVFSCLTVAEVCPAYSSSSCVAFSAVTVTLEPSGAPIPLPRSQAVVEAGSPSRSSWPAAKKLRNNLVWRAKEERRMLRRCDGCAEKSVRIRCLASVPASLRTSGTTSRLSTSLFQSPENSWAGDI